MTQYELIIFADYSQFLVTDEGSDENFDDLWTAESVDVRLAIGKNLISVGTAEPEDVRVSIANHAFEPDSVLTDGWEQVVECDLEAPSGNLVVMSVTDYFPDAMRIPVTPGRYRFRIHYSKRNGSSGENFLIFFWRQDLPKSLEILYRTQGALL